MAEPSAYPVLYAAPWTISIGDFVRVVDIRLSNSGGFRVWVEFSGRNWAWRDDGTPILVSVLHRWELVTVSTGWMVARDDDGRPIADVNTAITGSTQPPDATTAAASTTAADADRAPGDADETSLLNTWADTRSPSDEGGHWL